VNQIEISVRRAGCGRDQQDSTHHLVQLDECPHSRSCQDMERLEKAATCNFRWIAMRVPAPITCSQYRGEATGNFQSR
jgi:hypothetical protein